MRAKSRRGFRTVPGPRAQVSVRPEAYTAIRAKADAVGCSPRTLADRILREALDKEGAPR